MVHFAALLALSAVFGFAAASPVQPREAWEANLAVRDLVPRQARFITSPCTGDSGCDSGCCGFNTGKCAGAIIALQRDGGCGFGATPNDNAARAMGFTSGITSPSTDPAGGNNNNAPAPVNNGANPPAAAPPAQNPPTTGNGNNNAGGTGFKAANGRLAQTENQRFASLTANSSCKAGENACVGDSFAQCVGGKFVLTACNSAAGLVCKALPLVNSPGTSITCTTAADAEARIKSALSS